MANSQKTTIIKVNGQDVETHPTNTVEMVADRMAYIALLTEEGFVPKTYSSDDDGEKAINRFYAEHHVYGASINMEHPIGIHLTIYHNSIDDVDVGMSGLGYKTIGHSYAKSTLKSLPNRVRNSIKRAQGIINRSNAREAEARVQRQPLVAIAKEMFGDDVELKLYKGSEGVTVMYKGYKLGINEKRITSILVGGTQLFIPLETAKQLVDDNSKSA